MVVVDASAEVVVVGAGVVVVDIQYVVVTKSLAAVAITLKNLGGGALLTMTTTIFGCCIPYKPPVSPNLSNGATVMFGHIILPQQALMKFRLFVLRAE